MTFVEIRFKRTEDVIIGFAKLQLDLTLNESIDFVKNIFTASVQHIYIKSPDDDQVIKLEKSEDHLIKSFVLDFLELDKLFQ